MSHSPLSSIAALFGLLAVLTMPVGADAQAMPPSPVRFAEARELPVQSTLQLTGSVVAPRTTTVASEVAGIVETMLVREGNRVELGQPLARLRQAPVSLRLDAARGELAEAEARVAAANRKLERYRELASSVVSQQEIDEARYDLDAWRGRAGQATAMVAQLERDLENTTVRAPFAGIVTERHTHIGQWLDIGAPVATLVSLAVLDVHLDVPATYVGQLTIGAEVDVRFVDAGLTTTGTVRAVIPRADAQARTFPVYVALPADHGAIGAGMLAEVSMPVGPAAPSIVVPKDAVVRDGAQAHLFRLDGDRAQRVVVEPGAGAGGWIAVRGQVAAGDRVVVRGNERLMDGMTVQASAVEVPLP